MRFGVTRYGNLGWTSKELAAGKHLAPGEARVFCETAGSQPSATPL